MNCTKLVHSLNNYVFATTFVCRRNSLISIPLISEIEIEITEMKRNFTETAIH